MPLNRIAVLGGGAWGTALAQTCARAGREVSLWEYDKANADHLDKNRESKFLPGVKLDRAITVTADLTSAASAEAILLVVPAQAMRATCQAIVPHLKANVPLIACAKGIEKGTHKFMTEVIRECAPKATPAILSGPSFADDVARGLPTAVTLAAKDGALARDLAHAISGTTFRVYHSTDPRGVELGGAAKNVLAIGAGIVQGRKLGASALAAMTTRGFAELVRFGKAYGAKTETMMGLSGLGDLLLTCSTPQSRNFSFGIDLARGKSPREAGGGKLAEGAFTAPVLMEMARAKNIDMPISAAVAAMLAGKLTVDQAIEGLLTRPIREE
ncbi:MAG: NAD(P)-dependent glycerol-3-phosphate dehydrogenase [Pseudolabrys sp.]|nr:NAD(P)-dependent glycerol-3-phosphate dehydrogenase [Pseudolabrys sp.]